MRIIKIEVPDKTKDRDGEGRRPTISKTLNLELKRSKKKAILKETKFDLGDFDQWDKLDDEELLLDCLWICVSDHAQVIGVDEETFKDAIFGELVDKMRRDFCEEISDFFPPSKRSIILSVLSVQEKKAEAIETAAKQFETKVPKLMEKIRTKTDEILEENISEI
jgi:hypothetical protein